MRHARFDTDQTFSDIQVNNIEAMDLVDGKWYVVVKGDYAGRVSGAVYDITNSTAPAQLTLEVCWLSAVHTESAPG
jgi:hypothetical protein